MTTKAFQQYLHNVIGFNRAQLAITTGLRKGLGVAVPLITCTAIHQPFYALVLAIGALGTGFADQGGAYRSRARIMLLTAACMAGSALVGATLGGIGWLAVLLMAFWGLWAGLLVAVSQGATTIGTQAVVALAVTSSFHFDLAGALLVAGLLVAGSLFQTTLSLAPWPLGRHAPERSALAGVYQKLAANAEALTNRELALQVAEALTQAGSTIAASVPRFGTGRAAETFQGLLAKAWGVHLELIALAEVHERLAARQPDVLRHLDALLAAAAEVLRAVAGGLAAGRAPGDLSGSFQQIEQALKALRCAQQEASPGDSFERAALANATQRAEALNGKLRAAARIETSWAEAGGSSAPADEAHLPPALRPQSPLTIIHANLTLRSLALRHAIRISVTLALAVALYTVFPLQRGYWIPLTVMIVLRPDFSTTVTRGLARGAGTLLGAGVAGLLLVLFRPDPLALAVIAAVLACAAYAMLQANYTLFVLFVTGYVAALISLAGAPTIPSVVARVEDTLIGSALAMAAIILWPSWGFTQVPHALAQMLEADRAYFASVMDAYLNQEGPALSTLREQRMRARLARSNAEAAVQRSLSDPARYHANTKVALGVLESTHRLMRSALTLEALRKDARPSHEQAELGALSADVQKALRMLAGMVEEGDGAAGAPLLPLRNDQQALAERLATPDQKGEPAANAFLAAETERIVDSVLTMSDLLSSEPA